MQKLFYAHFFARGNLLHSNEVDCRCMFLLNVRDYIWQHFNGSVLEDGDLEFTGIPLDAEHLAVEPKSSNTLNAMPEVHSLLPCRKGCRHFAGVQGELPPHICACTFASRLSSIP